jgi:hypothetical protein
MNDTGKDEERPKPAERNYPEVYKHAYDLGLNVISSASTFAHKHKFTFGERMCVQAQDLVVAIMQTADAGTSETFGAAMERALRYAYELRVNLRYAYDLRLISDNAFVVNSKYVDTVLSQLYGWRNSRKKKEKEKEEKQ